MKKINSCIVQLNDKRNNVDVLTRQNFDVDIKLLKCNSNYKKMIISIIDYMKKILNIKFDDYEEIKGISGANVGIPFRIIVIRLKDGVFFPMINPIILSEEGKRKVKSNCGSLRLKTPIEIQRPERIKTSFVDIRGNVYEKEFAGKEASTVVHETDHTNGILIIDKAKERFKYDLG